MGNQVSFIGLVRLFDAQRSCAKQESLLFVRLFLHQTSLFYMSRFTLALTPFDTCTHTLDAKGRKSFVVGIVFMFVACFVGLFCMYIGLF